MIGKMKIFVLLAFTFLAWFGWKLTQSPEKYLKKKSKQLIEMASVKNSNTDMSLISKVSKMAKLIHFDVQFKAEYEGQIFTAHSLNELRSLLLSYFKQKSTGKINYKNLNLEMAENKKQAIVKFDALFERNSKSISCKALLEWIKDKKWYIKRIEIFPCFLTAY